MNNKELHVRVFDWFTENFWVALILVVVFSTSIFGALKDWNHTEIIALLSILVVAGIALMGMSFWHSVRLAEKDAALKRTMLERGLSPDDIERLLPCQSRLPKPSQTPRSPQTDAEAIEELGLILHSSSVPKEVIEEVFLAVSTAEPLARPVIFSAIRGLAGESRDEADSEQILAVLRGLRRTANPAASATPTSG